MDVMGMEATGRAARIARSDDKENWKLYKNMLRYANICYTQYSNFDFEYHDRWMRIYIISGWFFSPRAAWKIHPNPSHDTDQPCSASWLIVRFFFSRVTNSKMLELGPRHVPSRSQYRNSNPTISCQTERGSRVPDRSIGILILLVVAKQNESPWLLCAQ